MSNNSERYTEWQLEPPTEELEEYVKSNPKHTKYISNYETDVTSNPFRDPIHGRIIKLRKPAPRYPIGTHRWKKDDLRIIYLPEKSNHTIVTLDINTAGNVRYKKR